MLRNEISRVLRDVESGEVFEITVNGRVVAELRPPSGRPRGTDWQTAHDVIRRCRERADPDFWNDVTRMTREPEEVVDRWTRSESDT
jgi:antitoxin (DNA-binding transcriptional repressor) of toxin-antitoxin stability system